LQPHAQAGFGSYIPEEAGSGPVLTDDQVNTAVLIEISQGGTSLFTVDRNARLNARHWAEVAKTIAAQA
jgi:hypothetical protein